MGGTFLRVLDQLEWAKQQVGKVREAVQGFQQIEGSPFRVDVYAYTSRKNRIEVRWTPPDEGLPMRELSHLVVDAIHGLRSTLDYLVYELAIRKRGGSEPHSIPLSHPLRRLSFPIFTDRVAFNTLIVGRHKLAEIKAGPRKRIEALQPFGQPDHALWVLSELDNLGKHRQPPLLLRVDKVRLDPHGARLAGFKFIEKPNPGKQLKPNQKVAVLTNPGWVGEAEVNRALKWSISAHFAEGTPASGREVGTELRRLQTQVTRIVNGFRRDFPV